ncbi:hypothetical protein T12_16899 [Trichinella patagoniensis]|uniref:Uncharacterized protein n=1 Tax=Trichinella patagoniensis TaxID=990121 RepID=A0A0V1AG56_9BILA|nr:hypothetical protein T12_16899 [Trichinella patagoniensis]
MVLDIIKTSFVNEFYLAIFITFFKIAVSFGSILFPSLRNALSCSFTTSYSMIMLMKLASCFKYDSLRVISEIRVGEKINIDQCCFRVDIKITETTK